MSFHHNAIDGILVVLKTYNAQIADGNELFECLEADARHTHQCLLLLAGNYELAVLVAHSTGYEG